MKDRIFVDTNILVYAHDFSAGEHHAKASAVIESLWEAGTGGYQYIGTSGVLCHRHAQDQESVEAG